MATSEHDRLEQLFSAAVEKDTWAERIAFLDAVCSDEPSLRSRVEELLSAHDRVGSFLDVPPIDPEATLESTPVGEETGMRVGRYKILQKIGEGGFGVVYMAEQEHPVRRKVALKIIKLGMDTRQVVARFEAERQALALMDHPGIARVFDAGATEQGRPYFVMELVRGIPITAYCDKHSLPIRARMELFVQVCHAVQHAHQKGIIHRDLKPNNVLVTLDESQPVPKVIDFGIAKATSQRLTEKTLFTEFRQFIGTPEYMSPDQAEGGGLEVDTRTDIYSLGVLLYELVTGTTPFDAAMLRRASYAEIQRMIKDVEPPKPSARLQTLAATAQGESIADLRRSEPAALARLARGDLDWIAMKAMEKDRTRRYATAKDLADDVDRHLRCEPVLAGPPGASYKLRKFVRRNQVVVLAGLLICAAVLTGLSLATVGLIQANRARAALVVERDMAQAARAAAQAQRIRAEDAAEAARREAAESAAANRFIQDMLRSVDPSKALGREVTVRYVLDEAAGRIEEGVLADQPEVEAAVRTALGETYEALGLYDTAETHLRAATGLRGRVLGEEHPDTLRSSRAMARVLRVTGKFPEAEALLRMTAETQQRVLGEAHPEALTTFNELALALWGPGRFGEAEAIHRRILAMQRRVLGPEHVDTVKSTGYLGAVCRELGRFEEAERLLRQALESCQRVLGDEHPCTAVVTNELGLLLEDQREYEEAEGHFRRAYEADRRVLGVDHPGTLIPMNNLLRVLQIRGKTAETRPLIVERLARLRRAAERPDAGPAALHLYAWELLNCEVAELRDPEAALPVAERAVALDGGRNARTLETLALACYGRGDLDRAIETQRRALANARAGGPYNRADLEATLAEYLLERGDVVAAVSVPWRGLAERLEESFITGTEYGSAAVERSRALMAQGRYDEAATLLRGCLAARQTALPEGHWLIGETMNQLGAAIAGAGRYAEAEPLLLDGFAGMRTDPRALAHRRRSAIQRIIHFYTVWEKPERAAEWTERLERLSDSPGP